MGADLRRVQPGDRFAPRAADWNAMVDAARRAKNSLFQTGHEIGDDVVNNRMLVRNSSGRTLPQFSVLAIAGVVIEPSTNLVEFSSRPILDGITPSGSSRTFVICQEPIEAGALGSCVPDGVTPTKLNVLVDDGSHNYATMGTSVESLISAETGSAEILWREGGLGVQWALVRLGNTPSEAQTSGEFALGIVVAPGVNGSAAASYTIDLYGSDIDSLFDSPVATGVSVVQTPATDAFWRGELVGLTKIDGTWHIQKFLSLPIAYTVSANQVCLRMLPANAVLFPGLSTSSPTNFLVDLNDCKSFFNNGAESSAGYVAFDYGSFCGLGVISIALSVPVRYESGWNLATNLRISTLLNTAAANLLSGTVSGASDAQDSITSGWVQNGFSAWSSSNHVYASGSQSISPPNSYIFTLGSSSSKLSASSIKAEVYVYYVSTPASFYFGMFSGMPTLPTIPDAIDSSTIILWLVAAQISASGATTGLAVTKLDPTKWSFRQLSSGSNLITGSYSTSFFTEYVPGPVSVF